MRKYQLTTNAEKLFLFASDRKSAVKLAIDFCRQHGFVFKALKLSK